MEPTYTVNWLDLPAASATTHLLGSRVTYTMTPRMFASALLQYNSVANTVAANARLRWEYRPGSELFVVYNDQRFLTADAPVAAAEHMQDQRRRQRHLWHHVRGALEKFEGAHRGARPTPG